MADVFNKIGKSFNEVSVEVTDGFARVADAASVKAAYSLDSAVDSLKGTIGITGLKLPIDIKDIDINSVKLDVSAFSSGLTALNSASLKAKTLLEKGKDALLGVETGLKSAFSLLPKSVQTAVLGNSGVLGSLGMKLPGSSVTGAYSNFYNKVVEGGYILNPSTFKRDINNLSAITKSALLNGVYSSVNNLTDMLSGKPGTASNILTKVAMGVVISKNQRALTKIGINLFGSNTMSIATGKDILIKKAFKELKLPKIKLSDLKSFHNDFSMTASVFDKRSMTTDKGGISAYALVDGSATGKKMLGLVVKDKSISLSPSDDTANVATLNSFSLAPDALRAAAGLSVKPSVALKAASQYSIY